MGFKNLLVIFVIFLISNVPTFAFAKDDEEARSTLKGLKGLFVSVNFGTPHIKELQKIGLQEEILRADIELKLRMVGINVISTNKIPPEFSVLNVNIGGYYTMTNETTGDRGIAFVIDTEIRQPVYLIRNKNISVLAGTWSIQIIGLGYTDKGIVNQIRNSVKESLDFFLNAYLSVNPK
jgi:hypothetical protein